MEDFEYARDRILMGLERKTLTRSNKELMNTAIHEAGHVLSTYYTAGHKGIYKSTIAPRGDELGGVTQFLFITSTLAATTYNRHTISRKKRSSSRLTKKK